MAHCSRRNINETRDSQTVIDKHYIVVVGRRIAYDDSKVQQRRGVYRQEIRRPEAFRALYTSTASVSSLAVKYAQSG